MTSTQFIAKEGYRGVVVLFICVLVCWWLGWEFLGFLAFVCLVLWFYAFRNPERLPEDRLNSIVLAPIDGKITQITSLEGSVCLCIKVGWFDVGVLRAPVDSLSYQITKRNGLFLHFAQEGLKNRLNTKIVFSSDEQNLFDMELFPEFFTSARLYAKKDFIANERMGFMKLGSVCVKFPANFLDLKVNVGDTIKGGETLIGYIK
ncbi:hypothetical protein BKH46_05610 [Helicobacter sp. 12S02634-8]|uniref:phosphatidylserine decarboxylase n=1 Tax=Helicobacter sp. 12S02634-8 TaxID=1476199 RepID=UPI000BA65497|nr:phosphatidylserine decarboxylase [Helicobacter sp. 12S02634-8]PAF46921.1 hypothetical protein BKH46_05610 [Helicobacter sp. 12S02634-8]